jgi:hypothetical protein
MKHLLILITSPKRRLSITVLMSILSFFKRFIRPQARAKYHWIGKQSRLQRPERAFIILVFAIAIILLEPYEYAVWATVVGGLTAMTIPFISLRYILRAHWIDS